ncbi:MAG: hypothetical protein Q9163_005252, partial [Psora crenata]
KTHGHDNHDHEHHHHHQHHHAKMAQLRPTRQDVIGGTLYSKFGKKEEYGTRLKEWKAERDDLLRRQQNKANRKLVWADDEEYVDAWRRWFDEK